MSVPAESVPAATAAAELIAAPQEQPVLRAILRGALTLLFRGLVRPPMPVAGQRLVIRLLTAAPVPNKGVTRTAEQIGGRPCEWHRPAASDGAVLLYLHGGAYLIGAPSTHRGICSSLARRAGLAVCALDYRLAPEHAFPAPLDDAVAAYRELLARGYKRIFIGGDSAGGNLTLVTALRLRELGLPAPAGLVCYSPVVDFTGEQMHTPPAGDPLIHRKWIEQAVELYCPSGIDRAQPLVSPINADLGGLPPVIIQVGEDEVLRNDSLRLAEKARAAGVNVTLERYAGLWHVFQAHVGMLRAADRAMQSVVKFLKAQGA